MRIAVTNHHGALVGGTESYLRGVLPGIGAAGHEVMLFHEAPVFKGVEAITEQRTGDWAKLASFRPDLVFHHGLQSPAREHALADLAPVVQFAHNYHGTCISGEKTRKLPAAAPCDRVFGPLCLAEYLPRHCGGWNPLVMAGEYQTQSARLRAMKRARVVVTASRHMAQEYRRNGMRDVQVAPLFANLSAPAGEPSTHTLQVLFAGRMTRLKGAVLLAEAVESLRDVSIAVTFAGDGPERAAVQSRMPGARFPGWVSQQTLAELACQHHLFAMPGMWPEPFGLAGLESGLPVVAFAVGGIPEWLTEGENGALAARPGSVEDLAGAIRRCAAIPNGRERARRAAERFTLERHLAILLPILEEACGS